MEQASGGRDRHPDVKGYRLLARGAVPGCGKHVQSQGEENINKKKSLKHSTIGTNSFSPFKYQMIESV